MRHRLTPVLISLITTLVLVLGLIGPAIAADSEGRSERPGRLPAQPGAVAVYHGPVEVTLAHRDSDGHQLGDLRVTSVETSAADGRALGRLEATLTTTALDIPNEGDEIRMGTLVFTFGDRNASQVVVQGSARYPGQGSTIATGDTTVRAIVGGSGRFAGVSGDAVTEHLDDGTWVHYLRLQQPRPGRALGQAVRQRLGEGLREWRARRSQAGALRREAQAERKSARQEARTERNAQRQEARAERREALAERKAQRKAERGADPAAIDESYTAAVADETGVVRTDLGIAEPASAPGEELGLWHYMIPARSELAPHTHPGWQLARVTAGELEYGVIRGQGQLLRADGSSEPMGPGTYILASGDGVIENPDLVHFGANRGDEVVTIISATLFPGGAPVATLVEEPAAAGTATGELEPATGELEPADEETAEASPAA